MTAVARTKGGRGEDRGVKVNVHLLGGDGGSDDAPRLLLNTRDGGENNGGTDDDEGSGTTPPRDERSRKTSAGGDPWTGGDGVAIDREYEGRRDPRYPAPSGRRRPPRRQCDHKIA